jgi:hypothetical protein
MASSSSAADSSRLASNRAAAVGAVGALLGLVADPAGEAAGQKRHGGEHHQHQHVLGRDQLKGEARLDEVEVVEKERDGGGEIGGPGPQGDGGDQDAGQEHHREAGGVEDAVEALGDQGRGRHDGQGRAIAPEAPQLI